MFKFVCSGYDTLKAVDLVKGHFSDLCSFRFMGLKVDLIYSSLVMVLHDFNLKKSFL